MKNTTCKMTPSTECSCCPYGFHIDRDFVRFCDSIYNNGQLDKVRQHKRERRKQKKTVESYLGLGRISPFDQDDKINCTVSPNANALSQDFYLNSDGLKNAVLDFENAWQSSLKKRSNCLTIDEKKNGFRTETKDVQSPLTFASEESHFAPASKSRSSSMSSISSHSTAISSISVPSYIDGFYGVLGEDHKHISSISTSKPWPNVSHNMGIHKSVLTNIREQMASSLHHMKELEEQVKCIPILQVKLSALKEEKKSLLKQLSSKTKSPNLVKCTKSKHDLEMQLRKLENEGIMSPTISKKILSSSCSAENLSSPAIASSLNASVLSKNLHKEELFPLKLKEVNCISNISKNLKSVGTSCSVLTRDVGVGYVPCKLKSVAVGNDLSLSDNFQDFKARYNEKCISLSSESLDSDLDSFCGSGNSLHGYNEIFVNRQIGKSHTKLLCSAATVPVKCFVESATSTDIMCCDKCVNTDIISESKLKVFNDSMLRKHKSILAIPQVCSKSIQVPRTNFCKSVGVQVLFKKELKKEIIQTISNKSNCDIGIGDSNINDVICFNCTKPKVSTAIGDSNVHISVCDKCSFDKTVSSKAKSDKVNSNSTISNKNYNVCDKSEQKILNENQIKKQFQSVAVNTNSEFFSCTNLVKHDIQICDKCSATIQCVAQDLAADTTDSKVPKTNLNFPLNKNINSDVHSKCSTEPIKSLQIKRSSFVKNFTVISKAEVQKEETTFKFDSDVSDAESLKENSSELEMPSPVLETLPDFTNLPNLPRKKIQLSKEVRAACKVLNDNIQKPDGGNEKKMISSLNIIQKEWFKVANQKNADPLLIEDYLDAFEDFSRLLLHRIVNLSDCNGNTAIHYAVSYGNFDALSILIDSKVCDVNKKNKAGYTSIMLVALADMKTDTHYYVVQRLFSIGDINEKATQNGQTALMLAVSHGKKEIAKILLDAGAEINLQDKDGSTALMCAAEHGYIEIVKLLLLNPDCDPTIVDNDGWTALNIAMEAGHKDIGLLIYTSMNFSRGNSPYSTLKRKRSTPPPRTPTLRTPPLPSPSARSTNSLPSFQFPN